ncbi:MAG: hypothetical protein RLO05_03860 [Rhodospirillales bacterium]|tara:strand:- start:4022 stop:4174 length:153 start_codon:yes stop_codon:yes gene_type:complete
MHKSFVIVVAATAVLSLTACDEKEPSTLTFDQAVQKLTKGADSAGALTLG